MKNLMIKLFLTVVLCTVSATMYAQTACDNLFASGVKLQQTMTVSSQYKAITYFEKAKLCYDSQAKKDLCDQQIKSCRNIIAQINKNNEQSAQAAKEEKHDEPIAQSSPSTTVEKKRDVKLSASCEYVKFKSKGGEFKKVKVLCNYQDWEITEKPSWVNCSRSENGEIVIEAQKYTGKDERMGILKIECGDKSVNVMIMQEKRKKLGVI